MTMMRRLIFVMTLAALAMTAEAKVRLPHMIGDNMVVQQQTEVRLWGWDKPKQKVTVTTSWSS